MKIKSLRGRVAGHTFLFPVKYFLFMLLAGWFSNTRADVSVLTYHNDNTRAGQNTNETVLTLANVNTNTFSRLFTQPVDGYVYAQPLVMTGVAIPGKGTHDVVFVATENDSVYAFDANDANGTNSLPLWRASFTNATVTAADNGCGDLTPKVGITATPVIDPVSGTLYVEANTKESGSYFHRLHALDITTGAEKFSGPILISGTVSGAGVGSVSGQISFTNMNASQFSRAALLLDHGIVYVSYTSHCDNPPYHGWVFAYNAQTLAQVGVFNSTPNGSQGAIWHCGNGPSADANGNVYLETANGSIDTNNNDFAQSFLKLTPTNMAVADYFMTYQASTFNGSDADVGVGTPVVLPDSVGSAAHPHLLVGVDKYGDVFLIDRDNMGHFNSANNNQIVQFLGQKIVGGCWTSPTYFNHSVYIVGSSHNINAFGLTNGALGTSAYSVSTITLNGFSPTPVVSANGTANAILWLVETSGAGGGTPGILQAYNATNLTQQIYTSNQAGTRDQAGPAVKFIVPVVANGKVYVGSRTNISVYGLTVSAPAVTSQPANQTNYVTQTASFTVSASGASPLSYQWRVQNNGAYVNISNGGQISGATSNTLSIANLTFANATNYLVVITNSFGSVTSAPVHLTVLSGAPFINMQPASQTNYVGLNTTFTVAAGGLPPLFYHWLVRSNGTYVNPSGSQYAVATNSSFTVSNLTLANATNYQVIVTNSQGSVTSSPAMLTVLTNAASAAYQTVVLADSPTAFWPMHETSGTTVADVAGSHNGTVMNGALGVALGVPGVLYSNGITSDTAYYFTNNASGGGGYVDIPYAADLNTANFTAEAWLNMPTFPAPGAGVNMNPLGLCNGIGAYGWTWNISSASGANPTISGWCGKSGGWTAISCGVASQNKWTHYVITYDGTTFKAYTNGVLAGSAASTYHQVNSGNDVLLGDYNNTGASVPDSGRYYRGAMENVAIYNYALSAAQVANHYMAGTNASAGPTPPSVSLTSPTNSSTYTAAASITLNATASSASSTIDHVSFYNGATLLGTVTNSPYSFTATGLAAGSYSLSAVAVDSSGLSATSAPPVSVTVAAGTGQAYGISNRVAVPAYLNMPTTSAGTMPTLLSQTGVFTNTPAMGTISGLIPYLPNVPLWSDGALKTRYLGVPYTNGLITPNTQIAFAPTGTWNFPNGTVFVKTFQLNTDTSNPNVLHRLETRLLVRDANGAVYGVTYKWRADNSEADLLTGSLTENILVTNVTGVVTQSWYYPSPQDCLTCHTPVANYVLGVSSRQLNGINTYSNGVSDNQLRALNRIGLFNPAFNEAQISTFPKLSALTNLSASLEERARSYLDANCAQCHQPGGDTRAANFDARYDIPLASQKITNSPALVATLGISDNACVVRNKDIWRSVMIYRMNTNDALIKMPPLARNIIDTNAVSVFIDWVNSLTGTPALQPVNITPNGGSYVSQVNVTLQSADPSATIYYTLDGLLPTTSSLLYSAPFNLTSNAIVSASAYKASFVNSAAASAVFTIQSAPSITAQPANRTNFVGETAAFNVTAGGAPILVYRWQSGVTNSGVFTNLTVNARIPAVTNATLNISNLALTDIGDYRVIVTNGFGSITSAVARLTVLTNMSGLTPYQSTVLGDGPVAFWPLNEIGGTVIHDIAGTNNGTAINATSGLAMGVPGVLPSDTAIYFTNTAVGGAGYISVPYSTKLNSPAFSVEAWLNMPTFPAPGAGVNMNPLGLCNGVGAYGWTWNIQSANGANPTISGWCGKSGSWTAIGCGIASQNKWTHYVITYDGTTFKAYTNGVLAGSAASTYHQVGAGNSLFLGDYNNSGGTTPDSGRYYRGAMQNVAVYTNVLTANQITNHYYVGTNAAGSHLQILTPPAGVVLTPILATGGQFQLKLDGTSHQNYALQVTTNLSSGTWNTLFTTNNGTNTSLILIDPNATNEQRYYRVLTEP